MSQEAALAERTAVAIRLDATADATRAAAQRLIGQFLAKIWVADPHRTAFLIVTATQGRCIYAL
jgi:hypothetical protein